MPWTGDGCQFWCLPAVWARVGHLSGPLLPHQVSPVVQGRWEGAAGTKEEEDTLVTPRVVRGGARNSSTSALCHLHLSRPLGKNPGSGGEVLPVHRSPESTFSLRPHCWGTPGIFHQPQRAGSRIPQSFWKASLLFQQKQRGSGQKGGAEGREDSQAKPSVLPCHGACSKSRPLSGSRPPHLYHEEHELDQGVSNPIPNTKKGQLELSLPDVATRTYGPGVARTLGFVQQSQKSGFLCAITSFFNICKTFSWPNETRLQARIGPQASTLQLLPHPSQLRASLIWGFQNRCLKRLGPEARRHPESRSPPRTALTTHTAHPAVPSEVPTHICTCGGWKRPWLML